MLESDRPHVLREMMYVCRPAGVLSVAGVYGGLVDKIPFGAVMNKGLTIRTGQTHVKRWTDDLLQRIERRPDRSRPSSSPTASALEDGPGHVQDLPRQGGRLHQGRHEAVAVSLRIPLHRRNPMNTPPCIRCRASFRPGPWGRCASRRGPSAGSASRVGLAELAMPRKLARLAGAAERADADARLRPARDRHRHRHPDLEGSAPWLWGRLAGDALDVATVGAGLVTAASAGANAGLARHCCSVWPTLDMKVAEARPLPERTARSGASRDYSDRSGFPKSAAEMRGIARRPSSKMTSPGLRPAAAEVESRAVPVH